MSHVDLAPTRRALVSQAGLLVSIAATSVPLVCGAAAERSLLSLGKELDACHAASRAFDPASQDVDPFYDRHWALREAINVIPAQSYEDLKVKARAAAYALEQDPCAECDVAGSFIELSRSLIADTLQLQQCAA